MEWLKLMEEPYCTLLLHLMEVRIKMNIHKRSRGKQKKKREEIRFKLATLILNVGLILGESAALYLNRNTSLTISGSVSLAGKLLPLNPGPPRLEFYSGR